MSTNLSSGALRALRALLPDAEAIETSLRESDLYGGGSYSEAPIVKRAQVLEGAELSAIPVPGPPEIAFGAFLDGVQHVRIFSHRRGIPIIAATVAAAVRVRAGRKLVTWDQAAPVVQHGLYLPFRYLPQLASVAVDSYDIIDTAEPDHKGEWPSRHPGALRATAISKVGLARELIERRLAELWCERESTPIFIDGGISGSMNVAESSCAVGVIKSHQTLYAGEDALEEVMTLKHAERSSVFEVEHARRTGVMSWYLRVRNPRGHDAMFGLVRVEVARTPNNDVTERAHEVSRWILAEVAPLALPDSRWDKMMYGVRDCEEFLRAIST